MAETNEYGFDANGILDSLNQIKNEMKLSVTSAINNYIEDKFSSLELRVRSSRDKIHIHEEDIKNLRRDERRKNVVIFGLPETESNYFDLEKKILELFNQKMRLRFNENDIDYARRIGRRNEYKPRPILLSILYFKKKLEVMSCRGLLKNTNISVNDDYPPNILNTRKKLIPIVNQLRKDNRRAFIRYDKLIVDGKTIDHEQFSVEDFFEDVSDKSNIEDTDIASNKGPENSTEFVERDEDTMQQTRLHKSRNSSEKKKSDKKKASKRKSEKMEYDKNNTEDLEKFRIS